jgi:pimeloyl-ACP methyl ester carboxylesterase
MKTTDLDAPLEAVAAFIFWLLASYAAAAAGNAPTDDARAAERGARELNFAVPVTPDARILVRVCRPSGETPARLVVINHGSPANSADRPHVQLGGCDQEAAQWFLNRNYVVAFPLRRGYGATGGKWVEGYDACDMADYFRAGLETARDINAAVEGLTTLPFVRPEGAVVIGQSAGGWGTIAYDSLAHPKVAAFIVMAGGRGGHMHDEPHRNCHPERLVRAAGQYGKTASTPMLWVYSQNDTFFDPSIARALYQSFTASGGRATFEQPGPFGTDGHHLFFGRGGSVIWGPLVESYLASGSSSAHN